MEKNEFEFTHLILDNKSTIYAVCPAIEWEMTRKRPNP